MGFIGATKNLSTSVLVRMALSSWSRRRLRLRNPQRQNRRQEKVVLIPFMFLSIKVLSKLQLSHGPDVLWSFAIRLTSIFEKVLVKRALTETQGLEVKKMTNMAKRQISLVNDEKARLGSVLTLEDLEPTFGRPLSENSRIFWEGKTKELK